MSAKSDRMAAGAHKRREQIRRDMTGESVMTVTPDALPAVLTVVTQTPTVEDISVTPDNETTRQPDNQEVERPAVIRAVNPKPSSPKGNEKWRKYAIPNLGRGRSENVERINITVSDEISQRLTSLDALIAQEGGRHAISRNALLSDAIDLIADNPDHWLSVGEMRPVGRKPLQGRVTSDKATQVAKLRYSETGRRNITGMLAAAVEELLSN